MAVTAKWYANGLLNLLNGNSDFLTDTIKVALCSSSYTPNQSTHDFFNDVTNELTTANGYTAGGATLGTKTATLSSLTTALKAADTVWTPGAGETLTARYAVIYRSTGTASTSALLGYVDFGADVSAIGDDFTIDWDNTDGVLKATVS